MTVQTMGFIQGRGAVNRYTVFSLVAGGATVTATALAGLDVQDAGGGSGTITHAVSVSGLTATITATVNSTANFSGIDSKIVAVGNGTTIVEA